MTIWLPTQHDGYEVSDAGQVRSLKTHRGIPGPRLLALRRDDYASVTFSTPFGNRIVRVHDLVAAAFHGPRPSGLVTRHLNGDRFDNRVQNLAYGTYSENLNDAVEHGSHYWSSRTECVNGHPWSAENTQNYVRPSGKRQRICRACRADRIAVRSEIRRRNRDLAAGLDTDNLAAVERVVAAS